MQTYIYKCEQLLSIDINKAWDFFSRAKNLALITPPELDFKIISLFDDKEIYEGMLIDYTVAPFLGLPLRWQSEICKLKKPVYFTDRQVKGPYDFWEHRHTFIRKNSGVLMTDEITYRLPFGVIGRMTHSFIVRKKIQNIFKYRQEVLNKLFVNYEYHNY